MRAPDAKQAKYKIRRHIFMAYRHTGVRVAVPMFLLFGVMDILYRPDLAPLWIGLRFGFALSFLAGLPLLAKDWFRNRYSQHIIVLQQVVACTILNIMIAMSGGYSSLYVVGLILTSLIAINIFKISPAFTLFSLTLCYVPTLGIIALTAGTTNWIVPTLYTFYFTSLGLLCFLYSSDQLRFLLKGVEKETDLRTQLKAFQRSEILKRQFPESLRKVLESGLNIPQRKFIPNAVVGFADITNSSRLANLIGLNLDWKLKETFLEEATKIATQHDFVVLTQLGDGFLFLCNYEETSNWHFNLIGFFEALQQKLADLKISLLPNEFQNEIDLKCGAAMGPTLVGFLGSTQTYFTAIGPEVNLAARLCSKASGGEFVLSSKIWYILKNVGMPWSSKAVTYNDLKGFDEVIGAAVIQPHQSENHTHCEVCSGTLKVVQTPEGLYDLRCPNDHAQALNSKSKKAA